MISNKRSLRLSKNSYLQISFLPWMLLRETRIGPVTFWPFYKGYKAKIKDDAIRDHLLKYFHCYVDHDGKRVETITVCTYEPLNFRTLSDEEHRELRNAVDALIFSTIAPQTKSAVCANNKSMGPPATDAFQLINQNFLPGNDHIAVRSGTVLSGGWEIGEIVFPKPWSTGGVFGTPDEELVKGFDGILQPTFSVDLRQRVFRSLEWFRLAHVGGDDVSQLSKVVMMATAFEIILQVPNRPNKKGWIAEKLDSWCTTSDYLRETRNQKKDHGQTYSKMAWWAWDFYELRNSIVHGDLVDRQALKCEMPRRDWLTQLIVADLVFWECVQRVLFDHNVLGDKVRDLMKKYRKTPSGLSENSENYLIGWLLGFRAVHEALGWLAENKESKYHL